MREEYIYPKNMYQINPGIYCGVFVPEHVMKKILKLTYQHYNNIQKVLNEFKDELLPEHWTLANKEENGKIEKQITIRYALINDDSYDNVENRIKLFKPEMPKHIKELYFVDSREQAKEIAEEILTEELQKEHV
jgi:hypothetical protein